MATEATREIKETSPSFITTLPDDVLLHLFHVGTFDMDMESLDPFPILASHICHHWRDLALGMSTLWTTVVITNFSANFTLPDDAVPDDEVYASAFPQACAFLERSRLCPLNVQLDVRFSGNRFSPQNPESTSLGSLLAKMASCLLAPHAARFKKFTLLSDTFLNIISATFTFFHVKMPLLEQWHLVRCSVRNSFDTILHYAWMKDAFQMFLHHGENDEGQPSRDAIMYPNLKRISLYRTPLNWSRFALVNLQSLALTDLPHNSRPSAASLRDILLANEHSLEDLDLGGALPVDSTESYSLSNLHTLTLGYTGADEAIRFVQSVHVPKLTSLCLKSLRRHIPAIHEHEIPNILALVQEILHHMPVDKLTHLSLHHVAFYPPDPHFPHIVKRFVAGAGKIPVPLAFFSRLTALRSLSLYAPDDTSLHCLNIPFSTRGEAAESESERGSSPAVALVVPNLRDLRIRDLGYPELRSFVAHRCFLARGMSGTAIAVRPLERLLLAVPHLWEQKINQVADKTVVTLVVNEFGVADACGEVYVTSDDTDIDDHDIDLSLETWFDVDSDYESADEDEGDGDSEAEEVDEDF